MFGTFLEKWHYITLIVKGLQFSKSSVQFVSLYDLVLVEPNKKHDFAIQILNFVGIILTTV